MPSNLTNPDPKDPPTYENWTFEATPTLLMILSGNVNTDEYLDDDEYNDDGQLISMKQRTADGPRPLGCPSNYKLEGCDPTTKEYATTYRGSIVKTIIYTLLNLQDYPWHDTVTQTGWMTTAEAKYVRDTTLPPRVWTKTAREKNDKVQLTWQVPMAELCKDFVSNFIPRVRDLGIEPAENVRIVIFLHTEPPKPKEIIDLSEEEES